MNSLNSLNSDTLRSLANALDEFTDTTKRTGVTISGYSQDHITVNDLVIEVAWVRDAEGAEGAVLGRYVIDFTSEG